MLRFVPLFLCAFWCCRKPEKAPERPVSSLPADRSAPAIAGNVPLRLAFDAFTVKDGLCSNEITKIFQDSRGFLWIGTEGGLNRYDGYAFQVFRHKTRDSTSLPANEILDIGEDSRGRIWVLTLEGLSCGGPDGRFTSYPDSSFTKEITPLFNRMVVDRKDRVWVRCEHAMFRFDPAGSRMIKATDFRASPFMKKNGDLYAFGDTWIPGDSMYHYKVLKWNETAGQLEEIKDTAVLPGVDLGFNDGAFDREENVWFCHQNGRMHHFNFKTGAYTLIQPKPDVPARFNIGSSMAGMCYSERQNALWLASYHGLIRYDLRPHAAIPIIRYQHNDQEPKGLPVRVISRVLEDRAGNLWVGTSGGGLCRYSPGKNKFRVFQKRLCDPASLPSNSVEALCYDPKGHLWVGTNKGLCLLDDPEEGTFRTFTHTPIPGIKVDYDWISDMAADTAGQALYMAYWGNLPDVFDLNRLQFRPLETANLPPAAMERWRNPYMSSANRDRQGHIFYGSWSGGILQQYAPESREWTMYGWKIWEDGVAAGAISNLVTIAYPDREGNVWLGNSEGKGLTRVGFPKNGQPVTERDDRDLPVETLNGLLANFKPDPQNPACLQDGSVTDMLEDARGRLWVGTRQGLHWMQDRKQGIFRHFGTNAGLPDNNVNSIVDDAHGHLWLGTNRGLCRFDPDSGRVTAVYGLGDGLPDNVFSPQACARAANGELAFGTPNGFCTFHPDSLFRNTQPPTLEISRFEVNGLPHAVPSGGAMLLHSEKNLAFDFSAMDFSNPEDNLYRCFLEGYDTGWCAPAKNRHRVYMNLAPGAYTLRVRGSNHDGVWSAAALDFPVTIAPPWWERWWFRICMIVAFFGLIAWVIRRREQNLLKKQADNEKLIKYLQVQTLQAQINPHFIFNVLGAMQNQILNSDAREANRHLVNLSKLIRRFLDSNVSSAPPGKGMSGNEIPLEQEMELLEMYVQFEQLQRPGKFEYTITVDPSINVPNEMIPPMIVQPYVENAVKHGILYKEGPGSLEICFFKSGASLICTVADDGVGRDKAGEIQRRSHRIYKSHGTRLVQERVGILNELGYSIGIRTEDRATGGTLVTITITE